MPILLQQMMESIELEVKSIVEVSASTFAMHHPLMASVMQFRIESLGLHY